MSRHRNIEEEYKAISPVWRRNYPAQPITAGITGSGGADSAASASQASQEIQQLEAQFRQQSTLIQANTQALQNNTGAHSSASVASGALGGGLGLFSPVISGLLSLFGVGGSKTPAPLPYYAAPPSVQIGDTLRSASSAPQPFTPQLPTPQSPAPQSGAAAAPNVTVNVSAMDSQSFMDRSNDIASAVREAMLNLHPINDVVASL